MTPINPYLTQDDVRRLAAGAGRLTPLLIRFDGCRCTAPAQDVERIIRALERDGDYCRDVSRVYPHLR